jgi:hypothetical protein
MEQRRPAGFRSGPNGLFPPKMRPRVYMAAMRTIGEFIRELM